MRVSIGVLAWNEETSIAVTLKSVLDQSLLRNPAAVGVRHVEILCVPNGCTDSTADRARDALAAAPSTVDGATVHVGVREVQRPSKANAWNEFVHELSDRNADFLILMDGDVRIEHPESLSNMVRALTEDSFASIAGARTVKHIATRRSWNPLHWISLGASSIRRTMPGTFAGCLYCARAATLRQFRLPRTLIGEDVFVRAMVVTDFFTHSDRPQRVIVAPDATVMFEAYTAPRQVFRNLKRRALTLAIDGILFDRLWSTATPEHHGGSLLIEWDRDDPEWDTRLLQTEVRNPRWRANPLSHFPKWLARLRRVPPWKAAMLFPAALAAGTLDAAAQLAANRSLRRGEIARGWFTKRTNLGEA